MRSTVVQMAALIISLLTPTLTNANTSSLLPASGLVAAPLKLSAELQKRLAGLPVYIQIFKEEGILELYIKLNNRYRLLHRYPVCKFSGGLGPKHVHGDLKSPEGFYSLNSQQLNPNSRFYKSMDLGFPNAYDRAHGYQGSYLMVHGSCVSQGCYAMTDNGISDIYYYVEHALTGGQSHINVSIYPFRMSEANMQRHKYSSYMAFWQQLKPAYDYFVQTGTPPVVSVNNGRYVVSGRSADKTRFAHTQLNQPLAEVE